MPDASSSTACITKDAKPPLRLSGAALNLCRDAKVQLKLTEYAIEAGKKKFNVNGVDELADRLGYKRLAFYRLRVGRALRPSLEEAVDLAAKLGVTFTRAWERV